MAKITNKSLLNVGTELTVNEINKTITLNPVGNLVAKDGVTWQVLYSKLVDLWTISTYQDSEFPAYAIDALSGQFEIGTDGDKFSGWTFGDDATRQMLRDGGWSEYNSSGALTRQYVGIVGLGAVSPGSQLYYHKSANDAPTNFTFTDQCNEGIQVFGDATNGNFDKRSYFKGFVREQGKKYKDSVLADTGRTATGPNIVNLLLSNESDLKIQAPDSEMTNAPYNNITVSYFTANQIRSIAGSNYNFKIIINGNNATLEQIYTKVQYLLRQSTNINAGGTAGNVIGKTAASLLSFIGDALETTTSVYIDGIQTADSNRVKFKDDSGTFRENLYTASGVINCNAPLVGAGSSFRMMYSDHSDSIVVNDAAGLPIAGTIVDSVIEFDYDYDGNSQGGYAPGTDRNVTILGIRPGSAKYVAATGVLTRSKSLVFSLTAEQDRVYS